MELPSQLRDQWKSIIQLMQGGEIPDAANALQRLLKAAPEFPGGWNNLGVCLRRMQRWETAEACFRRGLALPGGETETAWSNYGNALRDNGRFKDAEAAFLHAIAKGGSAGTLYNYSLLLRDMNQPEKAIEILEPILATSPENESYRWDYALMLLQVGRLKEGFSAYESRWALPGVRRPSTGRPLWNGEDLAGKTLLLMTEQGMGDSIQFARYIGLIPLNGGRVVLQVRKPLQRLFQLAKGFEAIKVVTAEDPLPEHDYALPIVSLADRLGEVVDTIPDPVAFHVPEKTLVQAESYFAPRRGRQRLGFIWGGSAGHKNDRNRSCRVEDFLPLLSDPRWDAYSFQVGDRAKDLARSGVGVLCSDLSGHISDFFGAAAFLKHIDIFVTVDTGPAHLAGSLGVPTVILTPEAVDWRWGTLQSKTPWYSSVSLLHQSTQGDWESAFAAFSNVYEHKVI